MHDADAIGERERLLLIVRHQDRGHPEPALHLADGLAQLDADLGIQRAEGLIEQQHLRLVRERARHGDALLLAARELSRQPIGVALERHQLQQLVAPAAHARAAARRARAARTRRSRPTVMWRNSA